MSKLNARKVETAPAGRYGDGNGLWLTVTAAGGRNWSLRYTRAGKSREMGLGSWPAVSLAEARARALEARKALASGHDPIEARKAAEIARRRDERMTFGAIADELFALRSPEWRSDEHRRQWRRSLETDCVKLRKIPIIDLTTDDVIGAVSPIWGRAPVTARRLAQRISDVFEYARVKKLLPEDRPNPARWSKHLEELLPRQKKEPQRHHSAIDVAAIPGAFTRAASRETISRLALQFLVLTAVRAGECIGARWSEIDREAKLWTIPGERMKSGRPHQVPLSNTALAILDKLAPLGGEFVFPGQKEDAHLSFPALRDAHAKSKFGGTIHGIRSTFRDWCGDVAGAPRDIAEAALAHTLGKTERAYRRGTAVEMRRALMEEWAAFLVGDAADESNVLKFPRAAATTAR